jgi:hypothetical protein
MSHFSYLNTQHIVPSISLGEYVAHGYAGPKAKMVYAMGYNPGITGENRETVWPIGGNYAFMSAEAHLDIVSTSATDSDALNTGAEVVQLTYLDSDYVEHIVEYSMNGQTDVVTADDVFRVNDFRVHKGTAAVGVITAEQHGGTTTQASISAGETRMRQLVYTVPDGYSLQISAFAWASSGSDTKGYLKYTVFSNYCDTDGIISPQNIFYPMMEVSVQNTGIVYTMPVPLVLPEHTDVYMSVIGDAATLTAAATSSWRGIIIPNE